MFNYSDNIIKSASERERGKNMLSAMELNTQLWLGSNICGELHEIAEPAVDTQCANALLVAAGGRYNTRLNG